MPDKKVNILGIDLDNYKKKESWQLIKSFLAGSRPQLITTVNPEFILAAIKDEEFFYILEQADLSLVDGGGLWFAGITMGKNLHRYPGVDLTKDLLKLTKKQHFRILIFNWRNGLTSNNEITHMLEQEYSGLDFLVMDVDRAGKRVDWSQVIAFSPDITLAALGAPHQEKFLCQNKQHMPSVKIMIGIGGTFDFLCNRTVRAPWVLRILYIEWLWRAIKHPGDKKKRWQRIFRATVKFPLVFIRWRFISPWFYRPNVAVLVYKKMNDKYQILLVERQGEPGHWQIPQGGTGKLNLTEAGMKEFCEEIGTEKIIPVKSFPRVYQFKFGERGESEGKVKQALRHTGFKGQRQGLLVAQFVGQNQDIKINYWDHQAWKWVDADNVLATVHPIRRQGIKIFMNLFNKLIENNEI